MAKAQRTEQQRLMSRFPHCRKCGLHIGTGGPDLCGACAVAHRPLTRSEVRRFARLVPKHWTGNARALLACVGYRPTLVTSVLPHQSAGWSLEERRFQTAACAERAELANLYDRIQAARSDQRRACRS